jgi:hypothetical protein
MVYAMRHKDDPMRCTWFAFAFELFCQTNLENMAMTVDDFRPVQVDESMKEQGYKGDYYHRWYDRYLFPGNTKAQKGKASTPNPYIPCNYDNVKKVFKFVYNLIVPVIISWHILHLAR